MFVLSMKADKKKICLWVLLVLVALMACFFLFGGNGAKEASKKQIVSMSAKTNEERIAYLKSFGWTVMEEPCEIVEIAIPQEFDEVYISYNKIQKKQGFDLESYQGKRVKRFTYQITNYPNEAETIRANLLCYQDQIIGGDVCSTKLNGFMHGFKLEKEVKKE